MAREHRSDKRDAGSSQAAEEILQTVKQDLQNLRQDLIGQLEQDVRRLQTEKSRLLNDLEKLQQQYQSLQTDRDEALSRQQIAQQQAWAKQFAVLLANHLHTALSQRIHEITQTYTSQEPSAIAPSDPNHPTYQIIASLDDTVNHAFASLRHDLNSHQSYLAQQLDRMHNLGQQGEAILQALVGRISQQLQLQLQQQITEQQLTGQQLTGQQLTEPRSPVPSSAATPLPDSTYRQESSSPGSYSQTTTQTTSFAIGGAPPNQSSPPYQPLPGALPGGSIAPPARRGFGRGGSSLSSFQVGLAMILLSTVALSLHNVLVGIVGSPSKLFGLIPIGGFISLRSFGSSLLILWLRMLIVVPMMAGVAAWLYQPTWRDVRSFIQSRDRRLLGSVIGSGCFLFLSQVLIYIAIGQIGPGVAITILFMYPLVTVPLAWTLFGDRPTRLRMLVMTMILCGVALTTRYAATANLSFLGVSTAVISGICFALYLISMQISFRRLHPVPVSLIQFATIFVLSSVSLIVMGVDTVPTNLWGLLIGGLFLGALTLIGYLLNNFGVRFMGAARASIIAASGPALTALLAFLLTPGERTALSIAQILGILVVTLGVITLSFERMLLQNKATAKATR